MERELSTKAWGRLAAKSLSMSLCKVLPAAQNQASPDAVSTASTHLSVEHHSQVSHSA